MNKEKAASRKKYVSRLSYASLKSNLKALATLGYFKIWHLMTRGDVLVADEPHKLGYAGSIPAPAT